MITGQNGLDEESASYHVEGLQEFRSGVTIRGVSHEPLHDRTDHLIAERVAEITDPLHDTDYGSRDFALRDPEGNRWSFGTYRGEAR